MSSVSATGSSTQSGTLGDAPPVSFPGIASGIDYDAIIEKYTAETLQQEKPLQVQVNNITAANTAVLKIKNLLGAVQDSLTNLSDPSIFGAYTATPSNTASGSTAATLTQISGQNGVAGTYTVNAQTAATATAIVNNASANASLSTTAALSSAGTSITATNGSSATGSVTINGVSVNYDVYTQSITQILNNIVTQVNAVGGNNIAYTLNGDGTVTLTGITTLGSGGDSGNLLSVLKLDTAQLSGGTVTSSSPIAGINEIDSFGQAGNAGFATAVTAGTFTINGVQFTINPAVDSLSSLITKINSSTAGVTAQYNSSTAQLTLTSNTAGPQSILLGSANDTSNFLSAAGLTNGTTHAGTQASLTYTDSTGSHTVYSSTDTFNNVIPGFTLNVTNSSPASLPAGSTYYTVSVASDPSQAETAINAFIKAYNAAITELNKDLAAPTVTTGSTSTGQATSTSSGGGVLYNDFQISNLKDQLVSLVSGFIPSGSSAYNSLQTVGITLNTASQSVGTNQDSTDSTDSDSSAVTISGGTDGTLGPLDTTAFEAAYANNTAAVQSLFTLVPSTAIAQQIQQNGYAQNADYGFAFQLGSFITNSNGLSTFLKNSAITPGNLADATLSVVLDSNDQQIDSINTQIQQITQEATNQANQLRQQFSSSETQIAELQSLQQQIAAIGH